METAFATMRAVVNKVSAITDEDWQLLQLHLTRRTVKRGDHFIEAGKTYTAIGFVISGLFRSYYVVDGEEINNAFFFEQQWPKAYHSFLAQEPSRLSIQALEDAELFLISYTLLQSLFAASRNWERFGRIAAENLYVSSQQRAELLLLDDAETRYLKLLQSQPQLFERVPLYHIASYIGIKQPSLSRIRKRLMNNARL